MVVHPSNDEDPDEECDDVHPSIPDVFHGSMVSGCNYVDDSSLTMKITDRRSSRHS